VWIVLPTKGCKCATCEKTREVIDDDGNPKTGASVTDTIGFKEVPGFKVDDGAGEADCG
jgi:hypothetical protein